MDIREVITSLRQRINELQRTIDILETEFGRQSPTNQWEYIKQALEQELKPLSVKEILSLIQLNGWKTTSKDPQALLYVNMRDFSRQGKVVKMGRGLWGLPEWEDQARKKLAKMPLLLGPDSSK